MWLQSGRAPAFCDWGGGKNCMDMDTCSMHVHPTCRQKKWTKFISFDNMWGVHASSMCPSMSMQFLPPCIRLLWDSEMQTGSYSIHVHSGRLKVLSGGRLTTLLIIYNLGYPMRYLLFAAINNAIAVCLQLYWFVSIFLLEKKVLYDEFHLGLCPVPFMVSTI